MSKLLVIANFFKCCKRVKETRRNEMTERTITNSQEPVAIIRVVSKHPGKLTLAAKRCVRAQHEDTGCLTEHRKGDLAARECLIVSKCPQLNVTLLRDSGLIHQARATRVGNMCRL